MNYKHTPYHSSSYHGLFLIITKYPQMDLESQLSRETIPRIKHQYKCKCDLKNMIQKSKETFISACFFYVDYVVIFSP